MLNLGFTGTRNGLKKLQWETLVKKLNKFKETNKRVSAHHGMCIGADEEFHHTFRDIFPEERIVGYPCTIRKMRANLDVNSVWPAMAPLVRNKDIVMTCNILIVCPKGMKEVLRSGTWATYRYALKKGKKILIIYPDGTTR